jgi:serine/threonine protein kinase
MVARTILGNRTILGTMPGDETSVLRGWKLPGRSDYTPIAVLARGGMGKIELAMRREGSFERLYAVKRPHSAFHGDKAFQRMFLDEARIAGLIRHPNVIPTIDLGLDGRGPFLVMEYVEGISGARLIREFAARGDLLPIQIALSIMIDVARGLDAAHRTTDLNGAPLGIVHRDVSPSNIIVGFDGVVRITDFGVAKAFDRVTRTNSGVLKGRFGYMSPEQLRYQELDGRADVFSMGVVLFELLSSRRLYGDGDMPAPRRILEEPPPDLAEVRSDAPPALVDLLFRMLAKESDLRPQTAGDCATALDAIRSECVATEGLLPMQPFLKEHFGEDLARIQTRIQSTLGSPSSPGYVRRRGWFSNDAPEDWSENEDGMNAPASEPPPRYRRAGKRLLMGAALGFAVVAAALAYVWAGRDRGQPGDSPPAAPSRSEGGAAGAAQENPQPSTASTATATGVPATPTAEPSPVAATDRSQRAEALTRPATAPGGASKTLGAEKSVRSTKVSGAGGPAPEAGRATKAPATNVPGAPDAPPRIITEWK